MSSKGEVINREKKDNRSKVSYTVQFRAYLPFGAISSCEMSTAGCSMQKALSACIQKKKQQQKKSMQKFKWQEVVLAVVRETDKKG